MHHLSYPWVGGDLRGPSRLTCALAQPATMDDRPLLQSASSTSSDQGGAASKTTTSGGAGGPTPLPLKRGSACAYCRRVASIDRPHLDLRPGADPPMLRPPRLRSGGGSWSVGLARLSLCTACLPLLLTYRSPTLASQRCSGRMPDSSSCEGCLKVRAVSRPRSPTPITHTSPVRLLHLDEPRVHLR